MKKFLLTLMLLFSILFTSCTNTPKEENKTPTPPIVNQDDSSTNKNDTPSIKDDSSTNNNETPPKNDAEDTFENYGLNVIEINLIKITITREGLYTSMEEVGVYLYTYKVLPSNFKKKGVFNKNNYTPENKLSTGGDVFYNREGLLPTKSGRTYYECDIDYKGGSRNAKRIVFSSDNLIFYTNDHYESFSILKFIEKA